MCSVICCVFSPPLGSPSGISLRAIPGQAAASHRETPPGRVDSLTICMCRHLGKATASTLPLEHLPLTRRARTHRATEPRCMRGRAEAEVGVRGGNVEGRGRQGWSRISVNGACRTHSSPAGPLIPLPTRLRPPGTTPAQERRSLWVWIV
jgi:hypothetical protein